nr:MAG TPA: hypothetical protein [Caudoviricetes sp.]
MVVGCMDYHLYFFYFLLESHAEKHLKTIR